MKDLSRSEGITDIKNARPAALPKIVLLTLFSTFALLLTIADRAPLHVQGGTYNPQIEHEFNFYLNGVIHQTLPGPYVYRVLMPWITHSLNELVPFVSAVNVDFILKSLLIIAIQWVLFRFYASFLTVYGSLCGVFLFDFLLGFALSYIQGPSTIETMDIFNVLIFVIAIFSLRQNKSFALYLSLVIGALNRETVWFIAPVVLIHDVIARKGYLRFIVAFFCIATPFIVLHLLIHSVDGSWFNLYGLPLNVPFLSSNLLMRVLVSNFHVMIFVGPLIALSAYRFKEQPLFLKIIASITPLFIVIHYVFGTVIESRLWLPLVVFLIPLASMNLSKLLGLESGENSVKF